MSGVNGSIETTDFVGWTAFCPCSHRCDGVCLVIHTPVNK